MGVEERASYTLRVDLEPSYPLFVGEGVSGQLANVVTETRVAVLSDANVYAQHGERLQTSLEQAGKQVSVHTFAPGESSKSSTTYAALLSQLVNAKLDRRSAIVSLGGGVTGDLAGFVAASYMRGIPFYGVPTSLLAMVDASVGGKTGINLPEGKNLVGAFWQPKAVFIDTAHVRSLPLPVFKQGAVEHFKHGLLADPQILSDVIQPAFSPDGDADFLAATLARSVQVKAAVVAADEKEAGVRAHLNLGHTLGHALESASQHQLSHGEAIAYGLVFAARLAAARGLADETERTLQFLRWLAPQPLPDVPLEILTAYMKRDKKTLDARLRFVLLEQIGSPFIAEDVTQAELEAAWQYLKEQS